MWWCCGLRLLTCSVMGGRVTKARQNLGELGSKAASQAGRVGRSRCRRRGTDVREIDRDSIMLVGGTSNERKRRTPACPDASSGTARHATFSTVWWRRRQVALATPRGEAPWRPLLEMCRRKAARRAVAARPSHQGEPRWGLLCWRLREASAERTTHGLSLSVARARRAGRRGTARSRLRPTSPDSPQALPRRAV